MTLQDDRPNAVTVARAARVLIADPDRWTSQSYARTAVGTKCAPDDPLAARWCAIGAILLTNRSGNPETRGKVTGALWRAARLLGLGDPGPATVNDRHGHATVLAMYDRAIELLEQEAAAT